MNPDGTVKWTYKTNSEVYSSPAIGSDGSLYFGCESKLYALDHDGSLKWSYKLNGGTISSPAISADGTIYIGDMDQNLYAINPDGSQKWVFKTENDIVIAPVIGADGTIYIGSTDNNLYAINPNGTQKWLYTTEHTISDPPAIGADGTIYVSNGLSLHAIGPGAGVSGLQPPKNVKASDGTDSEKIILGWDNPTIGPVPDGYYVYRTLSSNGIWMYAGKTTTKTFDDNYPESGKTYYYKVQSYKFTFGYNDSAYSAIDSGSRK